MIFRRASALLYKQWSFKLEGYYSLTVFPACSCYNLRNRFRGAIRRCDYVQGAKRKWFKVACEVAWIADSDSKVNVAR